MELAPNMNEKPCATLRGNVVTIHKGGLYEFAGIAEGKPATVAVVCQSATGASTRVGEGQPLNRQALEGLSMVDQLKLRSLESPKRIHEDRVGSLRETGRTDLAMRSLEPSAQIHASAHSMTVSTVGETAGLSQLEQALPPGSSRSLCGAVPVDPSRGPFARNATPAVCDGFGSDMSTCSRPGCQLHWPFTRCGLEVSQKGFRINHGTG